MQSVTAWASLVQLPGIAINFTTHLAALAPRSDSNMVRSSLAQRYFVAKWFIVDKGVKAGPFSDDAFFKHLKGKDPARIQVWRQGMSAWVPASDIPQLVELMAPSRKATRSREAARPGRVKRRPWRALAVIMSVVVLLGVGVMIGLHMAERGASPDIAIPAAPVEPQQRAAPEPPAPKEPRRPSREEFANAVRKSMPLLDSLQQRFPRPYDDLVGEFYEKLSNGEPEAETAAAMRRKAIGVIKGLLPLADDDVLIELNKVVREKYRALNAQNPSHCYAFGSGADTAELGAAIPEDILRRERDLYEQAIKTAAARPTPDAKKIASLQTILRRALLASGVAESELSLLDTPGVTPAQHGQYCEVTILLFREIGKLPPEDAAMVMRLLMTGK